MIGDFLNDIPLNTDHSNAYSPTTHGPFYVKEYGSTKQQRHPDNYDYCKTVTYGFDLSIAEEIRTSSETRPLNLTVKIWVRVA